MLDITLAYFVAAFRLPLATTEKPFSHHSAEMQNILFPSNIGFCCWQHEAKPMFCA
jgi:hypothetical protein